MARRKLVSPTKAVTYRITESLLNTYDLLLEDPVAQRSAYGKKSMLVETLLTRVLSAAQNNEQTINVADLVTLLRGGK